MLYQKLKNGNYRLEWLGGFGTVPFSEVKRRLKEDKRLVGKNSFGTFGEGFKNNMKILISQYAFVVKDVVILDSDDERIGIDIKIMSGLQAENLKLAIYNKEDLNIIPVMYKNKLVRFDIYSLDGGRR